jgi:hypothetical protein
MRVLVVSLIAAGVSIAGLQAQQGGGSIDVPAGARVVLQAKGDGAQVYVCTAGNDGQKWVLKAPDAKLLDAAGKTMGSHFAGPTWRLEDGSQVQGELMASQPAAQAGSIAWLLLRAKAGTATGSLAEVAFIRRTETQGGAAPASGCADAQDAGATVRVAYTATYTFYAER